MRHVLVVGSTSLVGALLVISVAFAAPTAPQGPKGPVSGMPVHAVPDGEAGLPKGSVAGVKFITTAEMKKATGPKESGVFIVDSDAIPRSLQANLKQGGYTLKADGNAFDAKGTPVAIFVDSKTFRVGSGKSGGAASLLDRFAETIGDIAITRARAGVPHPFRCQTIDRFAVFDTGFCRYQRVHTFAEANGALVGGACGAARPETSISSIVVRAGFPPTNIARRSCPTAAGCSRAEASREIHYGCFWPGIGSTPTMRHQVNMFDAADGARIDCRHEWNLSRPSAVTGSCSGFLVR
ncbi:MAG: hypothetical protein ACKVRO_12700 [Micropepsaceae bacterium]